MTPLLSLIIPTYNRPDRVVRALESVSGQTLARESFEVIVVDDGSTVEMDLVSERDYPFDLYYFRKENAGATVARRHGVSASRGKLLVFMDDDVTLEPQALEALADCWAGKDVLLLGNIVDRVPDPTTAYARRQAAFEVAHDTGRPNEMISFTLCNTQLLGVGRDLYESLGGLLDPTGGWPNWDDLDFGYRAHKGGVPLMRCSRAAAFHWDHALRDLPTACRRWYRAAHAAARLFERYPELAGQLPMFEDKLPVSWQNDRLVAIIRKYTRRLASSLPALWLLETLSKGAEVAGGIIKPDPFYRWIIGAYLYRGLRDGRQNRKVQ